MGVALAGLLSLIDDFKVSFKSAMQGIKDIKKLFDMV